VVDVFDQVEEELRSARYKRLAMTWLPVVGGVLLVALIAALAWWGWQTMETNKADKASIAYERGLESMGSNNTVGADAAFVQAAKEGNGAYRSLALQQRAEIAVMAGKIPEAVAFLDDAAKASRDSILADAARLKAVWLLMDTAPLADIEARLEPLTGDKRPYRAFAREALAMAQLQHGKTAEARAALVLLKSDLDTPPPVAERAGVAIDAIDGGSIQNVLDILKLPAPPAPTPSAAPAQPDAAAAAAAVAPARP